MPRIGVQPFSPTQGAVWRSINPPQHSLDHLLFEMRTAVLCLAARTIKISQLGGMG